MILALLIALAATIAATVSNLLPAADFFPLPAGLSQAMAWLGDFIADGMRLLPKDAGVHLAAGLGFLVTVNLFVLPWLAVQGIKLPVPKIKFWG